MIFSLILLGALLPHVTLTAYVNVGIVNGTEAKPHSRPYMVSVQNNAKHKCGGFLVSERFVMTAAHCFKPDETLTVVAGAHDLRNENEKSVRTGVSSYVKHPSYNPVPGEAKPGDIMILKLEKKVRLNKNIKTIPISTTQKKMKADVHCSVAGWGSLKTNGSGSPILMEADVRIMKDKHCETRWGHLYIASKMMCVCGHGGSCDGDSGVPLVCCGTAVGVTSFGSKLNCNDPHKPEVYTNISAFLPWIKNVTRSDD